METLWLKFGWKLIEGNLLVEIRLEVEGNLLVEIRVEVSGRKRVG